MFLTGNGTAISSVLFKSLSCDPNKDFKHGSSLAFLDFALDTSLESGFNSVIDVFINAKVSPAKLRIGTSRVGSTQHLDAEMFKSMVVTNIVNVP